MNLLLLVSMYPHAGHPFSGVFNERCAAALRPLCDTLEVIAPRPYAPALVAGLHPRWRVYAQIPPREVRYGISISRPAYLQIPRLGAVLSPVMNCYRPAHRTARAMHRRAHFDAILSFDLIATGDLAWRLGHDLGIPAAGWSTASLPITDTSSFAPTVRRAVDRLRLVFYQSQEKRDEVARLLGVPVAELPANRHIVLSRGVPEPPSTPRAELRERIRREWKVGDDQALVLSIGRIVRAKGVFELLEVIAMASSRDPRVTAVLIGAVPGFDDREAVERRIRAISNLQGRVRVLPACEPAAVYDYLCAADIFAFPSHREGMPNSLLEAMSMGVPAIAFAIPPVQEIEAGTGGLVLIPPLSLERFAEAIVGLASDPQERHRIGAIGRALVAERFSVRRNMAAAFARLREMTEPATPLEPKSGRAC